MTSKSICYTESEMLCPGSCDPVAMNLGLKPENFSNSHPSVPKQRFLVESKPTLKSGESRDREETSNCH